jgi:hypothetical protein
VADAIAYVRQMAKIGAGHRVGNRIMKHDVSRKSLDRQGAPSTGHGVCYGPSGWGDSSRHGPFSQVLVDLVRCQPVVLFHGVHIDAS